MCCLQVCACTREMEEEMDECLGKILNPSSVKMRVEGERKILWRDMGQCNWKRERE